MTLMGVVTSYEGLLAARFFLGLTEAGLYPGKNVDARAHKYANIVKRCQLLLISLV